MLFQVLLVFCEIRLSFLYNACRFLILLFCYLSNWFSLKQNITRLVRQAFIHCCELHQVWEPPSITAFIYVARTLWAHALNSEHVQSDLWLPVASYWLCWSGLDHYCVGREDQGLVRTIKEAIYRRVNNPTLNRNIGKYNLNHIWDKVIFNTPELKLDSSENQWHLHNNGQAQTNTAND